MCTFLQSLNLNALPETNNTVYLIIPFSQAGSCWNACHFKISIACQGCPQHTLSNSCILCKENGAGLKARNSVKFCWKGMMCKEQHMTTVETTNNSSEARHYIYHNCACTYFNVFILYLKHDKCTTVDYVLHKIDTLQLFRLFHFSSWWKYRWIFLPSTFVCKSDRKKTRKVFKMSNRKQKTICFKMRKWYFVQLTLFASLWGAIVRVTLNTIRGYAREIQYHCAHKLQYT